MPDSHVRRGQADYAWGLSALLPRGIGWPRWAESLQQSIIYGLAGIFGYADGRADDLLVRESDPRQTVELLPDWERNWGLPDPCYQGPTTIGERQKALVQRMTIEGGQSRQFFIDQAAYIGYTIAISEYRPFMVGIDGCGDNRTVMADGGLSQYPCQIGPPTIRFAWTTHVGSVKLVWFRATKGQAGIDPHLSIDLALDLECVIRRWRPAHTEVLFDYSTLVGPSDPMEGTP